jgi:hypothetical protein
VLALKRSILQNFEYRENAVRIHQPCVTITFEFHLVTDVRRLVNKLSVLVHAVICLKRSRHCIGSHNESPFFAAAKALSLTHACPAHRQPNAHAQAARSLQLSALDRQPK